MQGSKARRFIWQKVSALMVRCIVKVGAHNEDMGANQHRFIGSHGWNVPWTVDCIEQVDEDLCA
jgi:hypothetical protein